MTATITAPGPRGGKPREIEVVEAKYDGITVAYNDDQHRYWVNGEEVPSVTTVLGAYDKPGLSWWGMKIGVDGLLTLVEAGGYYTNDKGRLTHPESGDVVDLDFVVAELKAHRLTVNHQRDKAATRGTAVHKAADTWATAGVVPPLSEFASAERGYVQALAKFLIRHEPEFTRTEVMVGSFEFGFAGTFDAEFTLGKAAETASGATIPAGELVRGDYKTSASVYPESHFPQLAAYEGAAVEDGLPASDHQVVIHLCADGEFYLHESCAAYEDFLDLKTGSGARERIKQRAKETA